MTQTVDYKAILASASKQKQSRPPIILAYGEKKLGKTTFGSQFPSPVFLCGEDGAHSIADFRLPSEGVIETWGTLLDYTRALAYERHDYKTVVADTVGPLSTLCLAHAIMISGKGSWEKMGWGKEEDLVREWRVWQSLLEHCRNKRGMTIVLLAHSTQRKVNNLLLADSHYVFQGEMHPQIWSVTSNWVDILLYAAHEMVLVEPENGRARAVMKEGSPRCLYAVPNTGFEAGVRGGYWLPAKFKLDYASFYMELTDTPAAIRERLRALAKTITPEPNDQIVKNLLGWTNDASLKALGDDVGKLRTLEAQLKEAKEPKK